MSTHVASKEFAETGDTTDRRSPLRALDILHGFFKVHIVAASIVLALFLVYALVGFLIVPYLAKRLAQDYVANELHQQLAMGEVEFNPFTFQIEVRELDLREADNTPLFSCSTLSIDAELASLWQLGFVLKEVRLKDPKVSLIVEQDGTINLAKLVPQRSPSDSEDSLPRVRIGTLAVGNGRLDFEDRSRARSFTASLAPIHFALRDFRTDSQYRNAYAFSGISEAGERLEWVGDFTVDPLASRGRFSINDLKARTIDSYMHGDFPFRMPSGTVQLQGDYRATYDQTLTLNVELPHISVADLKLAEAEDSEAAPVSLRAVEVRDAAFSYPRNAVSIESIQIDEADVRLRRDADASINLARLFSEESSSHGESGALSESNDESARAVTIQKLEVTNSSITAEDHAVNPAVQIKFAPVSLVMTNLSTQPSAQIEFDATAAVGERGKLHTRGKASVEPITTELTLEVSEVALSVLQPYLAQTAAMTLHSGNIDAKGTLALDATTTAALKLRFDGDVRLANLRTTDHELNEEFIKWRDLALDGIRFSLHPNRLSIARIVAREPYARVIIAEDGSANIARVFDLTGAVKDKPTDSGEGRRSEPSEQSPFPIQIKSVQIVGGSANFADYSIEPSFAAGILELNGKVTGLSSEPNTRAQVALEGKVDKYAPVDIRGEVNLLAAAKYTDLAMNFHNMELTTFNPYSGKFAGYNISKGKLSTELRYKVDDRKLDAQHHIVVDNLEFGAKTESKDAAPVPLKLAVALLKDRDGVIDLDVPVSGTLDDPKFRLGPIIWKAVINLLTKIVTGPFAALGALFGGGEELAYIDFPAGSAELTTTEIEKLGKLAQALAERPQLRLDVPLTLSSEKDGKRMAERALEERVPPKPEDTDERAQQAYVTQLETIYKNVSNATPQYPTDTETPEGINWDARIEWLRNALLEQLHPDQAALDAVARERAQAVQNALLSDSQIAPDRIFITNGRAAAAVDSGAVRMELKLE